MVPAHLARGTARQPRRKAGGYYNIHPFTEAGLNKNQAVRPGVGGSSLVPFTVEYRGSSWKAISDLLSRKAAYPLAYHVKRRPELLALAGDGREELSDVPRAGCF